MNNKILVILLSLTLSYTVNANNENVQDDTESIGYNRAQLREQIATAWQSIQPDTVLNQGTPSPIPLHPPCTTRCHLSTTSNPCSCEKLETNQDKYIVIGFTPVVFNNNTPHAQSNIFDFANLEGKIALKTEFLQDVEFGLGLRRGALRFEGGLRYTRLHINGYTEIENIDIYHNPVSIWDLFDQVDKLNYLLKDFSRETIDTLGPVAGIAYDIGRFYIGGKVGLVRAGMGTEGILSEMNDLTSFYQVNFGIIEELTNNLDLQAGYDYSRFNETRFVSDSAATSLAPIKRHGVHFRFLVSFGE